MSFEWRTDEDDGWPEEVETTKTAVHNQSFLRRRWRFLLTALVGLLAVWALVQWQINQRVAEATDTIQTEILAAHNFILQTAVSQDDALFRANLSGRNPNWTALQKTLLSEDLLLDRPMLGWQYQAAPARLTLDEVEFAVDSDLKGAVLLYPQTYAVQRSAGVTETVRLQQTAVYRQGTSRWLYSPPDEGFWGDWITYGGDNLTLVYPERDREIAVTLAVQLDRLLTQMCTDLADLNCDAGFQVHLRFDTDPQALLTLNEISTLLKAGLQFEMPTPTLIGLPTDAASEAALFDAYGVQVVTAVLAHQIEYECCAHQLFFRALRDYQVAQLGLQPWPLTPTMYMQILNSGFDGNLVSHWTRRWEEAPPQFLQVWRVEEPEPIWQPVYMLVEFLAMEETAVSPNQMMRLMNRNSYNGWLTDVLGQGYDSSTFERRLLTYIYTQSLTGQQAEPPIPLPSGKITLVCHSYGPASHVYSYDLTRRTWTERFSNLFTNAYLYTPDGQHFIVNEYSFVDGVTAWKISLVVDEEIILLEEAQSSGDNEYWVNYSLVDEEARYLIRYEYVDGESDISVQPTSCLGGDCPSVSLAGNPIFAPDKAHLLVEEAPTELINVGSDVPFQLLQDLYLMTPDGTTRQHLGMGAEPFWVNDTVYGFARMAGDEWELVTAVLDQNQPRYLLGQTELLDALPDSVRPATLFITAVVVNPTNPQELMLRMLDFEAINQFAFDTPSYLFRVELDSSLTGVTQLDFLRAEEFTGIFRYELDGRSLVHGNYTVDNSNVTWYILDPQTGELQLTFDSIGSLAGSEDGEWLVQVTDNYLLLHAVHHNYQHFIPHGFGQCHQVALSPTD